jgi:SNF family Na+-dependent transporter
VNHEQDNPKEIGFKNDLNYWLVCIGYAVGYGNVWRFPYLVFKNGGAVFLIPYTLSIFIFAVPMYYMETAIGQLIQCRLTQRYSMIN